MEPVVHCKHCDKGVGLSEAKRDGWVMTLQKGSHGDIEVWEHEPKKVWDNETKQYKMFPFCIAKQIKKGTITERIS